MTTGILGRAPTYNESHSCPLATYLFGQGWVRWTSTSSRGVGGSWSGGFRWRTIGFCWFPKFLVVLNYIRFPLYFVDPLSCILCTSSGIIQNPRMLISYTLHFDENLNHRGAWREHFLWISNSFFVGTKQRSVNCQEHTSWIWTCRVHVMAASGQMSDTFVFLMENSLPFPVINSA